MARLGVIIIGKLTYFGNGKDLLLAEVLPPHEVGVGHAGVVHLTHDGKEAGLFAALDDGGVGPEDACSSKWFLGSKGFDSIYDISSPATSSDPPPPHSFSAVFI